MFISAAQFESAQGETGKARGLYARAEQALKAADAKEERVLLLDSWLAMEEGLGEAGQVRARTCARTLACACTLAHT